MTELPGKKCEEYTTSIF